MAGVLRREKWIDTHEEKRKPMKMEADYTLCCHRSREVRSNQKPEEEKESPRSLWSGSANTPHFKVLSSRTARNEFLNVLGH